MSSSTSFDLFDYGVLSLMLVMSTCVGCYFGFCGPKIKSVAEFVNGSGKLKTIPVAISLIARYVSTNINSIATVYILFSFLLSRVLCLCCVLTTVLHPLIESETLVRLPVC